jgi:CBS domain-containing protein
MLVTDVMTRGAECIGPTDSLQEAAQKMSHMNIGLLPVCGDNDRLLGMITDRDITVRGVAQASDARTTTVKDVMTPDVVYCFDDEDVLEAARLMRNRQVRRLAVLNRDERLVGIVSLGDLAVETGDERLAGKTLEDVSLPT